MISVSAEKYAINLTQIYFKNYLQAETRRSFLKW